ncbi:D-serine deaminase-like pyridoxal phosphate-dependent protein [Halanaerobium sp. DL-01]|uniref:alanine racemase n=1 Tax=Halanaerobium sp. DL-01 TaxID=1653064 RepID=UPI000DF3BDA0|nr:alanine racemase [Halanaerobium sp. DL-01]RCW78654.1 D-serine deaminase-like pyridoxal phosphate-dependent protein [Halanaerobium sp. DL-01]
MVKREFSTPSFFVDLDILDMNIESMAEMCKKNNKELWPMVKTHKSMQIAQMQAKKGTAGFLAGTVLEAEKLVEAGFDSIALAYPVVDEKNISRIIELLKKADIILAFDGENAAEKFDRLLAEEKIKAEYLIIIDSGLHRLGVKSEKSAELAEKLKKYDNLILKGICTHPGQVYGAANMAEVKKAAAEEVEAVEAAVRNLEENGFNIEMAATGSTPTANFAAESDVITVLRPGNYVFYDNMQAAVGVVPLERCSLTVMASIISQPADDLFILNAGSKCLGLDKGAHGNSNIKGYGVVKDHPELLITGLSEEVAKVKIKDKTELKVGDKVEIIPNHSCSAANMTDYLLGHRKGKIEKIIYIDARGGSGKPPEIN